MASEVAEMAQLDKASTAVVGCLIDVSESMRNALETGRGDKQAVDRFRAILRAALKLARAEQRHNPNALMFIGAFGMKSKQTPVVDLYGLVDALLETNPGNPDNRTGRERLIALANENNLSHITEYINTKLTEKEARIIHLHLQRYPDEIEEFVRAIPSKVAHDKWKSVGSTFKNLQEIDESGGFLGGVLPVPFGETIRVLNDGIEYVKDVAENAYIDNSEAMRLARHICETCLKDFEHLTPRPVFEIIPLLERLQDHSSIALSNEEDDLTLLDELRPHIYGESYMCPALEKSLEVFREHPNIEERTLVLVSDGMSTDGNLLLQAKALKEEKVMVASIFLTDKRGVYRRLYGRSCQKSFNLNTGQRKLFSLASTVSALKHPIPVLASIGWEVPSSGECVLYATVCSSVALEEFCSVLLSARFGAADALLDIVGKLDHDKYIDNKHVRTCKNPSDQEKSKTCYAHAIAAVLHMALLRIYEREGGCPSIDQIRERILERFPENTKDKDWQGENVKTVLKEAETWYPPLRSRMVNEDGARQAVLHRRPVLSTFWMDGSGWSVFHNQFHKHAPEASRHSTLTKAHMTAHQLGSDPEGSGGHAVVLSGCDARSLTFLNSWGKDWGKDGSFSIECPAALELVGVPMRFFDVYWYEKNLTDREREAYQKMVHRKLQEKAEAYPSLFEFEFQCPECQGIARVADFSGSVWNAVCPFPLCKKTFKPESEHLIKALYARAGLGTVEK